MRITSTMKLEKFELPFSSDDLGGETVGYSSYSMTVGTSGCFLVLFESFLTWFGLLVGL